MSDKVDRGILNQVMWERNVAIEQLASIGKGLGQTMNDVKIIKYGYWKREDLHVTCSLCGFRHYTDVEYNFCPNCGGEMLGESEGIK